MMYVNIMGKTNAPIGTCKCNFPPFLEIMTDRPTNQPTDRPTDRPILITGKPLTFKVYYLKAAVEKSLL